MHRQRKQTDRDVVRTVAEIDQLVSGLEHNDPSAESRARSLLCHMAAHSNLNVITHAFKAMAKWLAGHDV